MLELVGENTPPAKALVFIVAAEKAMRNGRAINARRRTCEKNEGMKEECMILIRSIAEV
jgi:hypothetical protein